MPPALDAPRTLTVDCGGTGLKAAVLDAAGQQVSERVRVPTPYPLPPRRLLEVVAELVEPLPDFDRVSAGLPGIVRAGRVLSTPHYVTEAGPFTAARPDLVQAWAGYDVAAALQDVLDRPVRAVNDAELHGYAAISGDGFEVALTFGTGMGFALYDEGRLLPKLEMSAHPLRKRQSYDERLGNHVRLRVGDERWTRRVAGAIETLRPVLRWDRLYVGGGNARRLTSRLPADVIVVPNRMGLLGGVRLWQQ